MNEQMNTECERRVREDWRLQPVEGSHWKWSHKNHESISFPRSVNGENERERILLLFLISFNKFYRTKYKLGFSFLYHSSFESIDIMQRLDAESIKNSGKKEKQTRYFRISHKSYLSLGSILYPVNWCVFCWELLSFPLSHSLYTLQNRSRSRKDK